MIFRERKVCELTGLSRTTLWRLRKKKKFPQCFRLVPGGRSVGYSASAVYAWINARIEEREEMKEQEDREAVISASDQKRRIRSRLSGAPTSARRCSSALKPQSGASVTTTPRCRTRPQVSLSKRS
jgi:predicted DNA-binding transcriptional regulator AlpA